MYVSHERPINDIINTMQASRVSALLLLFWETRPVRSRDAVPDARVAGVLGADRIRMPLDLSAVTRDTRIPRRASP